MNTGFREVIGSWNIIPTSFPLNLIISASLIVVISLFSKSILPPNILPGSGIIPIKAYDDTDLPLPLSPTIPIASPYFKS